MALHRCITAFCLLCSVMTAAGQTEPVRDFRFTVDNHPFLSLSNPAMLDALIGVYERNILGYDCTAVLPYSQALSRFPASRSSQPTALWIRS